MRLAYEMEYVHPVSERTSIQMVSYSAEYKNKYKCLYNDCYHKIEWPRAKRFTIERSFKTPMMNKNDSKSVLFYQKLKSYGEYHGFNCQKSNRKRYIEIA